MVEYLDFIADLSDRAQIKQRIETDPGVMQQEEKLRKSALVWWEVVEKELIKLPQTQQLMKLRSQLLHTFAEAVRPVGLLDRFKTMGVIVSWWEEAYEESADLKGLANLGFKGLIESWVVSIKDEVEDEDRKPGNRFDPSSHRIVKSLVPEYLQEIEQAEVTIASLEQEKEAFELGDEGEADEEGEAVNLAKELETQLKDLKYSVKADQKRIKELLGTAKKRGSIKYEASLGNDTIALEQELLDLKSRVKPIEQEIIELEERLQPYKEILEKLKEVKRHLRELKAQLVERLQEASEALTEAEAQRLVLDLFRADLLTQLGHYVAEHRQRVISAIETWWDKYRVTLGEIEQQEEALEQELSDLLKELGYV